jgi:hypothetical protein
VEVDLFADEDKLGFTEIDSAGIGQAGRQACLLILSMSRPLLEPQSNNASLYFSP